MHVFVASFICIFFNTYGYLFGSLVGGDNTLLYFIDPSLFLSDFVDRYAFNNEIGGLGRYFPQSYLKPFFELLSIISSTGLPIQLTYMMLLAVAQVYIVYTIAGMPRSLSSAQAIVFIYCACSPQLLFFVHDKFHFTGLIICLFALFLFLLNHESWKSAPRLIVKALAFATICWLSVVLSTSVLHLAPVILVSLLYVFASKRSFLISLLLVIASALLHQETFSLVIDATMNSDEYVSDVHPFFTGGLIKSDVGFFLNLLGFPNIALLPKATGVFVLILACTVMAAVYGLSLKGLRYKRSNTLAQECSKIRNILSNVRLKRLSYSLIYLLCLHMFFVTVANFSFFGADLTSDFERIFDSFTFLWTFKNSFDKFAIGIWLTSSMLILKIAFWQNTE